MRVREATSDDMGLVYEWANDPNTRRWSLNTEPIPWESHVVWFTTLLADTDRVLYIGEDDGPVGSVRFDNTGEGWLVSITVAPDRRGEGLARPLLDTAMEHNGPGVYIAEVKPGNVRSIRLFDGWAPLPPTDMLRFRRSLRRR